MVRTREGGKRVFDDAEARYLGKKCAGFIVSHKKESRLLEEFFNKFHEFVSHNRDGWYEYHSLEAINEIESKFKKSGKIDVDDVAMLKESSGRLGPDADKFLSKISLAVNACEGYYGARAQLKNAYQDALNMGIIGVNFDTDKFNHSNAKMLIDAFSSNRGVAGVFSKACNERHAGLLGIRVEDLFPEFISNAPASGLQKPEVVKGEVPDLVPRMNGSVNLSRGNGPLPGSSYSGGAFKSFDSKERSEEGHHRSPYLKQDGGPHLSTNQASEVLNVLNQDRSTDKFFRTKFSSGILKSRKVSNAGDYIGGANYVVKAFKGLSDALEEYCYGSGIVSDRKVEEVYGDFQVKVIRFLGLGYDNEGNDNGTRLKNYTEVESGDFVNFIDNLQKAVKSKIKDPTINVVLPESMVVKGGPVSSFEGNKSFNEGGNPSRSPSISSVKQAGQKRDDLGCGLG